jgi:hypothetical protein
MLASSLRFRASLVGAPEGGKGISDRRRAIRDERDARKSLGACRSNSRPGLARHDSLTLMGYEQFVAG